MAGIRGMTRGVQNEFLMNIFVGLRKFERHFIKEFAGAVIFLIAMVFWALGGLFFLIEYAGLNKTLSFLIIGCILVLIGIIVKLLR